MKKQRMKLSLFGLTYFIISIALCGISWSVLFKNLEYSDAVANLFSLISILIAATGALLVVIQLRDTKRIQSAEFIMTLNQSFVENESYSQVYTELEAADKSGKEPNLSRIQISNYLTFFETFYILYKEGAVTLEIMDNLFSYRFFLAVHNNYIQRMKLISSPANFRNIYLLEKEWVEYRRKRGLKIYNEGYCLETIWRNQSKAERYEKIIKGESDYQMKIKLNHIRVRKCDDTNINAIMEFQEKIFAGMSDLTLLRRNTREMFATCLKNPNLTLGLYYEDTMIGIGILFQGKGTTEDLSILMKRETLNPDKSVNFKLVAIEEKYRGNGLQLALMSIIERYACINGYESICATVSPKNVYSKVNFEKRGYIYDHNMLKYGGIERSLFYKKLEGCKRNNDIIDTRMKDLENSYRDPDAVVEGIDLCKCFLGNIDIANTGDILEYIDTDSGETYYGTLMKNDTLSVCVFIPEEEKIQIKAFNERIGVLQLTQIYLNTSL